MNSNGLFEWWIGQQISPFFVFRIFGSRAMAKRFVAGPQVSRLDAKMQNLEDERREDRDVDITSFAVLHIFFISQSRHRSCSSGQIENTNISFFLIHFILLKYIHT